MEMDSQHFYQTFKKGLQPTLLKLFREKERSFPKLLQRQCHPRYQELGKTTTETENYKPFSLMNIDSKVLKDKLANRI